MREFSNDAEGLNHIARFAADSLTKQYPQPPTHPEDRCLWVYTSDSQVQVRHGSDTTIFSRSSPEQSGYTVQYIQYLGHLESTPCYAVEISPSLETSREKEFFGVRELFGKIPDAEVAVAGQAVQIIDYDRSSQFCGRCGATNQQLTTERAKCCPQCNLITYPRLSPAIIVIVKNESSILLVQTKHAPQGRFSPVAGFVEPGETIEHAVHREVMEETGITITNVRYFASEPWPFPNSLMIGFVADYAGGEVTPDGFEIETAGWFDRDQIPESPLKISIGRSLIDWWMAGGDER